MPGKVVIRVEADHHKGSFDISGSSSIADIRENITLIGLSETYVSSGINLAI